ncbi:hypothetical protein [Kibdelosporangium phytohabitans]|uniref:HAF family protein n=1 Tax=Kibdelosporangium phytohabitans TaxID=860235 RepID=A0A0N9IBC4_9PSEU|nr:hypothetical protein [Kibdelosporangium phytohabitans]ALG12130.1 hypothetical protein AOZ06_39415 [Kibdelosporangium phytohabitans]MBE1463637.1 putative membrane protein [Kibdelosporangium phytohabitans]
MRNRLAAALPAVLPAVLTVVLTGALAAAPVAVAAPPTVIDLGTLPGDASSTALGLNQNGVVIGQSFTKDSSSTTVKERAVKWNPNGVITALPTPQGDTNPHSRPVDINNSGAIAGNTYGGQVTRALRWNANGTITTLKPLPGDTSSSAVAITADGTVAGHSSTPSRPTRAVRWAPDGTAIALAIPSGHTESTFRAINDNNTVVGSSRGASGSGKVLRWDADGTYTDITAHVNIPYLISNTGIIAGWGHTLHGVQLNPDGSTVDLGAYAEPSAIGTDGTVLVNVGNPPFWHAAKRAPDGTVTSLPSLPSDSFSSARAINDAGIMVGGSSILRKPPSQTESHPVYWRTDGNVTALDLLPGGTSGYALLINDSGTITGTSGSANGSRAVIWRL